MTSDLLYIWLPQQPAVSVIIWGALAVVLMYIARTPAHQALYAAARSLHGGFRLISRSLILAEKQLRQRNREVLLAHGREAVERQIDREFQRVEALVSRDLSGYPSLQRDLKEQIARIDEDYIQSGEVPPQPPEWLKVIEAVAEIPGNGSPVVTKILGDIHATLKKSMNRDLSEYRKANKERHALLKKMMPYWRSLGKTLGSVEKKITGLEHRSNIIDEQMQQYEQILLKTDQAERTLSSSSLTQFFIAALVMSIAVVGGVVNFLLVALPMKEMVGAHSYLAGIPASDVAALFIIAIEVTSGLFLMESVGVTRLFPIISSLDDRKRKIIFWVTLIFLLVFASIESSLAYMREMLIADNAAITQFLSDSVKVEEPHLSWIPSVGQMVMGFVLPFALTFVAIPLESLIHSSRTVIGLVLAWLLRSLAFIMRLAGQLLSSTGVFLITLYDLIIFLPLRIEQSFQQKKQAEHSSSQNDIEMLEKAPTVQEETK